MTDDEIVRELDANYTCPITQVRHWTHVLIHTEMMSRHVYCLKDMYICHKQSLSILTIWLHAYAVSTDSKLRTFYCAELLEITVVYCAGPVL